MSNLKARPAKQMRPGCIMWFHHRLSDASPQNGGYLSLVAPRKRAFFEGQSEKTKGEPVDFKVGETKNKESQSRKNLEVAGSDKLIHANRYGTKRAAVIGMETRGNLTAMTVRTAKQLITLSFQCGLVDGLLII